jgi:hypothetical protein
MSQFPNSPKLVKGALLEFSDALLGLVPNIILFQYNPEQLSYKLDQAPTRAAGEESSTTEKKETFRTPNLPVESISNFRLILDATDQMERGDPITAVRGVGPAIAALEMMMFPSGSSLLNLGSLLGAGSLGAAKVPPQQLPLVLFVWGPWRVIPVNVTSVSVVEQEFDPLLNPTRAEVTISLKVISKDDLSKDSFAYGAYVWTQSNREINAALNIANTVQTAAGMLPF